jgi:acyl-coenzyme A synthetase/AMP-(fatty) acid ligase
MLRAGEPARSHVQPGSPVDPVPERFNAARHLLAENAASRGDKTALVLVGEGGRRERFTFAEIDRSVRALAAGFVALGLPPRSRIMIRMGNEPGYLLVYFAALAAGFIAMPSSPQLTGAEASFLLEDSDAAVVVLGAAQAIEPDHARERIILGPGDVARMLQTEPLPAYADTAADDPAYLIYTSGTTSRPKGVLHAHRAVWGRRPMHDNWLGVGESDLVLHAGTMNWTYTLGVGIMDPWARGATTILYNGPRDPAVWLRLIAEERATLFAAVPSVFRQMLKYAEPGGHDLSSLRHGITAGEALSATLLSEWQRATGKPLYEALGMSEISTYVSSGPTVPVKAGSPGRPQPGRRVAILPLEGEPMPVPPGETGLLAVHRSDPGMMLGYWNRPEEEAAVFRGEWFTGGDVAEFDEDGYLWFHGRADDVMNAFGYRVSPSEVEGVLIQHPAVHEVAVTEVAVREDLRVIAAFIVAEPGVAASRAELEAHCASRLAAYKQPREYLLVDALPRTPNGKIQRKRLAPAAGRRLA